MFHPPSDKTASSMTGEQIFIGQRIEAPGFATYGSMHVMAIVDREMDARTKQANPNPWVLCREIDSEREFLLHPTWLCHEHPLVRLARVVEESPP